MPTPPSVLAHLDERIRIITRPDGSLLGLNCGPDSSGNGWQVDGRQSFDGGITWTPASPLVALDAKAGGWGGCQPVATTDGEIHVLLMCDAHTGVFALPDTPRQPKPLMERHLDVWHTRTDGGGSRWREPVRIWEGYTGSINSAIQMRNGRLVLPFAQLTTRTWRERGDGLDAFWFAGANETIVLTSDDGEHWQEREVRLKVQTPSIGVYGAVEPVIIERSDGVLWMLIRTQLGRFYESFSSDGASWTTPRPSPLLSSDSPAGLVRLSDGRLVLLWNKCLRFPYAHGGRHVLHAAISDDDGRTWTGHREVARDPKNYDPPPSHGDHGTAYPFPVVLPDDRILITTGQGEGRIVLVALDPAWLSEQTQTSTFSLPAPTQKPQTAEIRSVPIDGRRLPVEWSAFGCAGVDIVPIAPDGPPETHDAEERDAALQIRRTQEHWPACAVWNHPLGRRGGYRIRLRLASDSEGCQLLLTDHFSVPFDPEDEFQAIFVLNVVPATGALFPVEGNESISQPSAGAQLAVETGQWHDIDVRWDCATHQLSATLGGQSVTSPQRHIRDGICYLRLKPVSDAMDGGFAVARVNLAVES
ncbi:MAG: exo-alpha-sialidase [Gemmatimonadetes bacterium]|jgi:hypothetical protein|nr:exo-alpha-sialidase [Gemmatimonadota bacterium]MBT5057058.1 exo-alpha-sialidase [Gemmatimonadota bacterium]MBT5146819.1 exo-alpha-sialidase [Gemmatimonadota bacterium]MBT5590108.1 exo-alpha-sialidase [Gemmatimonadota bacterium]MBT5961697.1 exo-alpha-sialidase [Gemmatimonadota bacterium]